MRSTGFSERFWPAFGRASETPEVMAVVLVPRPRPEIWPGETRRVRTGCGNLYVTVNRDGDGPAEVFMRMGKTGGCAAAQAEAVARLVSLALRCGVALPEVVRELWGIRCSSPAWERGGPVLSCPDALAQVLTGYAPDGVPVPARPEAGACPECGSAVMRQEGCLVCSSCGWSKCG